MNDPIVTAEVMREMDRAAIEEYGMPGVSLMENAGAGTAGAIGRRWPNLRNAAIICGAGNNGGDGYVIARHLIGSGISVATYLLADREKIKGDARINLDILSRMKCDLRDALTDNDLEKLKKSLIGCDLIVDAMLGTGITKELQGNYKRCVEIVNDSGVPVCAVDVPTGLNSDSGKPLGGAIKADLTCTYGLIKIGLVIYPGVEYVGDLVLVDIGFPKNVVEKLGGACRLLSEKFVKSVLPSRRPDAHKGEFGHLLIIAGSPGKTGAAALCAEAAVRSGAGLVTVAVPASLNAIIEMKITEAMSLPVADGGSGYMSVDAWVDLSGAIERSTALAIGPGLSTESGTSDLFFKLIKETALPIVIDADGLNMLAKNPAALKSSKSKAVLTPHPGEMSRLLGISTAAVQEDRIGAAKKLAALTGAVVVLKGARTIIADPSGTFAVNPNGNSGMASGGTGDALTGIIGALLAQGMEPFAAASAGTWIHGCAGDLAAKRYGETALKAGDIIEALPEVYRGFM